MKILIVANFTRDFSETDNGRFLYLAKLLANNNEVEIITTNFSHGKKDKKSPVIIDYPFKITMLDEPGYKRNISLRRFYSHYKWGRNLKKYLNSIDKPDVVYCAIPSLTGPKYTADYCRKNGIRFVIDIQDLWPEAFRMVFNFPLISDIIFSPLKQLANSIYSCADAICAVSETYVNRALCVNKKCKTGTTVFLGTNLDTFDGYAKETPIMSKSENELWLAYCGTLGASYDLTCVFDALDILSGGGILLKFIVMGNGPKKEIFEEYAANKNIDVCFTGSLPYNQMCALLCECDITINPITKGAAQSIINKHGDYASSGKPVINTQECLEYRRLVEKYKMGINCRNGDAIDVAKALRKLIVDKELRSKMGNNARKCAEECFDRKTSYLNLLNAIEGNEIYLTNNSEGC